jgi:hypothetical protein
MLKYMIRAILSNAILKEKLLNYLKKNPRLEVFARRIYNRNKYNIKPNQLQRIDAKETNTLSPRAYDIYLKLKTSIKANESMKK